MAGEYQLGERQASILRAIVREYIRTGEPVGSKYLVERARLPVSSATVRNEMARLEEMGFLAQPHTSAGRVPTEHAYRFVVDEIKQPRALTEGQRLQIANELVDGVGGFSDLLHRASDVVARFTRHAAAVLASRARPTRVRRLEVFATGGRTAMVVLIADNGRVEQQIVPLDSRVTSEKVDELGRRLSAAVQGSTLEDAMRAIDAEFERARPEERGLIDDVRAAMRSLQQADQEVVVGGVANLAGEEDFAREELHALYEALERQTALLEVLSSAFRPVSVRIGSEVGRDELRSCSIVVASFGPPGAGGSVGVIGPTRMDYERVIATANAVARVLENTLGGPAGN